MSPERQLHLFKSKRQRGTTVPSRNPPEFAFSCSVADLFRRWARPTWIWTHFPAGEQRPAEIVNGKRRSFAAERLKRMGLNPGWPDYLLVSPQRLLHCLELKRPKGGTLSEDQEAFQLWCMTTGVPYVVARTLDDVIAAGNEWDLWRGMVR